MQPTPGRDELKRLLKERNEHYDRKDEIEQQIRDTFEREVAVLVLDMCGFSRTTVKYGIIHFLSMITQMETVATPPIQAHGGRVVKQDADNLFATFPTVAQALEAGLEIFRAFEAVDSALPDERDIMGSIGIGFGPTLIIGEEDLFGNEMNLACKLGEDLADSMEILLTESAYQTLPADAYPLEAVNFTISGLELASYKLKQS